MDRFKDVSAQMSAEFAKYDNAQFKNLPKHLLDSLNFLQGAPVITSRIQLASAERVQDGLKKLVDLGFAEVVPGPSIFGPDSSNSNDISKWQQKDVLCQVRITVLGVKVLKDNKP